MQRRFRAKFYRLPGPRDRIFGTDDLDKRVRNAPERALTQTEIARYAKLQEGAARARKERRAQRGPRYSGALEHGLQPKAPRVVC
jgi:hypothetical protein